MIIFYFDYCIYLLIGNKYFWLAFVIKQLDDGVLIMHSLSSGIENSIIFYISLLFSGIVCYSETVIQFNLE